MQNNHEPSLSIVKLNPFQEGNNKFGFPQGEFFFNISSSNVSFMDLKRQFTLRKEKLITTELKHLTDSKFNLHIMNTVALHILNEINSD